MILEGLVTTIDSNGDLNIAPMGPSMVPESGSFELRPFESSQTYQNLKNHPQGVFHITDDTLLIARTAINRLRETPATVPAAKIKGEIVENCCRFHEFVAKEVHTNGPRKIFSCSTVRTGRHRDFFGFNRAKHAVLEATILATRIDFIPIQEIQSQFQRLKIIVDKTGGSDEKDAFSLLESFVATATTNTL